MKNHKIIASWDKIEPSGQANARMLSAILAQSPPVDAEKSRENDRSNVKNRWIPAVACLALLLTLTGVVGGNLGWFGSKEYTARLANGDTIVYHSSNPGAASLASEFPVTTRALTQQELNAVFPKNAAPGSAVGTFQEETGDLLRIEGSIGNASVIFAREGFPVSDVVMEGPETTASVAGVPVTTGYFITSPNSKGISHAVFFGSFRLGRTNVVVSCAGEKSKAAEVSQTTAELILQIIETGEPNLAAVVQ